MVIIMEYIEKKRIVFFALPICFTTYFLNEEKVTIKSGLFTTVEDDAYMYKIQDIKLVRNFWERIFGLGTIICYTGDTTHPELHLEHIKHSNEMKEYILKTSEEARRKKRTMHTLDIDVVESEDLES